MIDKIETQLKEILVEKSGFMLAAGELHEETGLYGKGIGLDSHELLSLILSLEDKFGIIFEPDDFAGSFQTFGALLRLVQRKVSENGNGR
jgi:acyl carrier protein